MSENYRKFWKSYCSKQSWNENKIQSDLMGHYWEIGSLFGSKHG